MLAKAGIEETFRFAFKGVSSHIPQELAVIQNKRPRQPGTAAERELYCTSAQEKVPNATGSDQHPLAG
jgi:hypothetical protein